MNPSTMHLCRMVYLIQWDEARGTIRHRRAVMAQKFADEFVRHKMACNTLGEAMLRVGKLNSLMAIGKTEDHFINPAGAYLVDCTCPGNAAKGITHQKGCPGNPPASMSRTLTEDTIRQIIREEIERANPKKTAR